MKKSDELKQLRTTKKEAQQKIVDDAGAQNRAIEAFTEDENTQFDTLTSEIRALDKQIERALTSEANAIQLAGRTITPVTTDTVDGEEREKGEALKRYDLHAAIRTQTRSGQMEGVEAEFHQDLEKEVKRHGLSNQGILIPTAAYQKRDASHTVTQDAGAHGGKLVFDDFGGVINELTPNPVIRQMGARYFGGLSGDLVFVTDDGGIVATWEGETDTVDPTKNAYGQKRMSPKRLSATVGISLQNLLQSSMDLQRHTAERIRVKNELAIDSAAINGSGTGNIPMGILNAAGVNDIASGTNGASPLWAHIVDMETGPGSANALLSEVSGSANPAAALGYLINFATKGGLKKTKHEAGDLGYLMARDNTINGYRVGVSNLVPGDLTKGTGTNLSAGVFGDFSKQFIGSWGFYDVVVDEITRKKEGIIEITTNQFLDILLSQPKAFSRIKDWDLS